MQPFAAIATAAKWYHLVWPIRRHEQVFKIPATARFCERAIRAACETAGWNPDRVVVRAARVEVLVRAGSSRSRTEVTRTLQHATLTHLRLGGFLDPRAPPPWEGHGWCAVVTRHRALLVLRSRLDMDVRRTLAP
ncbi:MAG TPA: hypothetical protein VGA22_05685 [Gemmatimonadales bacterium]|jgi:hypothetical protein